MKPNELLQQIRRAMHGTPDVVPPDWKPTRYWQKAWGLNEYSAGRALRAGVKSGILELKTFRVAVANRTPAVKHYRPVEKKRRG